MNEEPKKIGKKSRLARAFFALACLVTLIGLLYAEEDWRGWRHWHQFEQAWQAKGEHFDLAATVPPPVPEEQNFAMTPIVFTSYGNILTRDGKVIPGDKRDEHFDRRMSMPILNGSDNMPDCAGDRTRGTFTSLDCWQSYYRALAAKTNEFPVPAQPGSPANDVLLALSKYDPAIEELRVASRLPQSRYPVDYDNESPWAILLPHLAPLKTCAQVLKLRSVAELQNGQTDQALEDARLALQLADKVRTEPFLITHLVRAAMLQIILQPVWEGLAEHKWSDSQLAALDMELAGLDFPADYKRSMHGELGAQVAEMDLIRRDKKHLDDLGGLGDFDGVEISRAVPGSIIGRLLPTGWYYENEYRSARLMEDYYLPTVDASQGTFSPEVARNGAATLAAETKTLGPYNWYERLMLPALGSATKKIAYAQASVNLARTAIALERYRLAHGEYPETLDVLAPQFIAQVPHDVISGQPAPGSGPASQPLKYRREANGLFVLYSVGWNETDDGGVPAFDQGSPPKVKLDEGDWVWTYPQK